MLDIFILLIFVLTVDIIWLTVSKQGYMRLVKSVQGAPLVVRVLPALLSYACVFIGLVMFAIPMIRTKTNKTSIEVFKNCVIYGGGLGFVIYGVFNFTNMAIFKDYEVIMGISDTAWGVILFTISTFIYVTVLKPTNSQ